MNDEPHRDLRQPDHASIPRPSRSQVAGVGLLLLWASGAAWIVISGELLGALPISLPGIWYTHQTLCFAMLIATTVAGAVFVGGDWPRSLPVEWAPDVAGIRFQSVRLFMDSRDPLSQKIRAEVQDHSQWFATLNIVDAAVEPSNIPHACRCLPALEIEGRIRFRGDFRIELLRRMIQMTPPLTTSPLSSGPADSH